MDAKAMDGGEEAAAKAALGRPSTVASVLCVAFVASAAYELHAGRVDGAALTIVENTAPSVRELAAARTSMRQLELARRSPPRCDYEHQPFDHTRLNRARRAIESHLASYRQLPLSAGEGPLAAELDESKREALALTNRVVALTNAERLAEAYVLQNGALDPAFDRLDSLTGRLIQLNSEVCEQLAVEVRHIRQRSTAIAVVLDVVTVTLGVVLFLLAFRAVHQQHRASEARRRDAELRAEELDHFAGRVGARSQGAARRALDRIERGARDPRLDAEVARAHPAERAHDGGDDRRAARVRARLGAAGRRARRTRGRGGERDRRRGAVARGAAGHGARGRGAAVGVRGGVLRGRAGEWCRTWCTTRSSTSPACRASVA